MKVAGASASVKTNDKLGTLEHSAARQSVISFMANVQKL